MPAKKTPQGLRERLENETMIGVDAVERKAADLFRDEDFGSSKDGKGELFVKYDGLRRACIKAFKGIKTKVVMVKEAPAKENGFSAAVVVKVKFGNNYTASAAADCRQDTANKGFKNYTTQLAETRAAARCFRYALGLEITAQEEVTNISELIDQDEHSPMSDAQRKLVTSLAKKKGKKKAKGEMDEILGRKIVTLDELSRADAEQLLETWNSERKD